MLRFVADPGKRALSAGHAPKVPMNGGCGSSAAEHRALDRRGIAMVAADESPVPEGDPLLRMERRALLRLAVRDHVGAEELPVGGHRAEPSSELVEHPSFH